MFCSVLVFLWLVAVFVLSRPVFMLYTGALGQGAEAFDFFDVMLHGLPHDLCVASAICLPLWIAGLVVLLCRLRRSGRALPLQWRRCGFLVFRVYIVAVAMVVALVLVTDAALYPFWDIKLDSTVLAYLDSPRGAVNSVSWIFCSLYFIAVLVVALSVLVPLLRIARRCSGIAGTQTFSPSGAGYRLGFSLLWGVALCLMLRGVERLWASPAEDAPISVATVYYSPRQVFNHAAVNPLFSFFTSVADRTRGISPDTFIPDAEAARIFSRMGYNTESVISSSDSLLLPGCRQVVLIVMEGCGGTLIGNLCGKWHDITPCLDSLCLQAVNFEQCYANSFRTDRGLVSIISGYPAFPDVSVMRHADRCSRLPGLGRSMADAGFSTDFLYGGDRDFTRMADYLRQMGYSHVWGDADFTESERHTHQWGVTDGITFRRLLQLSTAPIPEDRRGRFLTFLTLSSHEPWEVPYSRLRRRGKIANSFAYLDHCLSDYLKRLRQSPLWNETLVVLVADHGIAWPDAISELNPSRYHIPLLWTGGAVRAPRRIPQCCNQSDLAATLLGQLGISHAEYPFSRDVLSRTYVYPSAQHAWAEGFCMVDSTGHSVVDIHTQRTVSSVTLQPCDTLAASRREHAAKAFLQTAYRHFEER